MPLRFLTVLLFCVVSSAQNLEQRQPSEFSVEGYARLLDLLFPREYPSILEVDFVLVLRFEPNLQPESQIVIKAWHGRAPEIALYTLSNDAFQTGRKYVAQVGKEDIQAIATSLKVQVSPAKLPDLTAQDFCDSFFAAMQEEQLQMQKEESELRTGDNVPFVLDGARYSLWYRQNQTEVHWNFDDFDIDSKNWNRALGRWMNRVRLEVETAK